MWSIYTHRCADKASESEKSAANRKFQEIAFAYAVLSDERRRKRYDLTGSTAESLEDDEDFDWLSFYREQFDSVISEESINTFSNKYKGSAEEREDLLDAYETYEGKLDKIYESVMLSDILEDDDRFRQILDEEIDKGTVGSYPAYERDNNDAQREKAKAKERKRREDFDKKHGKDAADKAKTKQKAKKNGASDAGGMGDLAALIQQRQKARMGNFFDNLEAKYAPKSRSKKRATPMEDEPTEEEFQAARERINKKPKVSTKAKEKKKKVVEDDDDEDIEESEEDEEDEEEDEEDEDEDERPKAKKRGKLTKGRGRPKVKA